MIWIFSRRKEKVRLETWYDKHTSEFVVDIAHPDGQRDSKRFLNDHVVRTWLAAWDRQLADQGWKQSGPFLSEPERHASQPAMSPVGGGDDPATPGNSPTKRTYATGAHVFEVTLSMTVLNDEAFWTVSLVTQASRAGKRLSITGIHAVVSSTPDATFARACDCIDKWLVAKPRG
jgi:hypothetical protein